MRTYSKLANDVGPGCYVDGHWGWRGMARMIEQFNGVAYDLDDSEVDDLAAYDEGSSDDIDMATRVTDLAVECEDVLNDLLPGSLVAYWQDGEFYVFPYCGDPETPCEDETCFCHVA